MRRKAEPPLLSVTQVMASGTRRAVARDRDPPHTPSLFRTTLERALSVSPKLATDLAQRVGLIEATPAAEEVDPLTGMPSSTSCWRHTNFGNI